MNIIPFEYQDIALQESCWINGEPFFTGQSIGEFLEYKEPRKAINKIVERTRKGGGELVNLMGTSAWYAPGAATAQMVEAIVDDQKRIFPVCAYLNGEFGLKDIYIGVPVILGNNGIEKIIDIQLNENENKMLIESYEDVKKSMKMLENMKLFEE